MIPPIDAIKPRTLIQELKHSFVSISCSSASSLCSMKCPNFLNPIPRIVSAMWNFIKMILCCGYGSKSTLSTQLEMREIPEIDPITLSTRDYFRNHVYALDSEGTLALREKRRFELTCNLFQTLAAGGPWHWYQNLNRLTRWQEELENINGDPLEFLYFIFQNRSMTALIVEFEYQATTSTALKMVRALTGRMDPWEEFLGKQANRFESQANADFLPGFCKALGLDLDPIFPLFEKKEWKQLILHVFEERRKHFQL